MVSKPIKIKDYMHPIENVRFELMKESEDKIQGRKGFIFKGFVTEKARIEQYLAEKSKYAVIEEKSRISSPNPNEKSKRKSGLDSKYSYVQPQMRFKPRTELERIFDAINEYSYGRVSKDVINKQLRKLDLNNVKKFKNANFEDEMEEENDKILYTLREKRKQQVAEINLDKLIKEKERQENMGKIDEENQIINDEDVSCNGSSLFRDKFKSKRKMVDNSAAKNLMKEYHYKTHFKAASQVAARNISTADNKSHISLDLNGNVILSTNSNDENALNTNISNFNTINHNIMYKTMGINFRNAQHNLNNKFNNTSKTGFGNFNSLNNKNDTHTSPKKNKSSNYNNNPMNKIEDSIPQNLNQMSKTGMNFTQQNNGFDLFQKFSKKFSLDEENLDIIECNPLLYNLNMNPLKKNGNDESHDQDKLNYLLRLASQKKDEPVVVQKKGVKFFKNLKDGKRKVNSTISENPNKFFKNYGTENEDQEIKRGKFYFLNDS
jgi:hypothetical protein